MRVHATRWAGWASFAGAGLLGLGLLAPSAAAQERVGEVVLAQGEVTSSARSAAARRLAAGDDVFLNARIETGRRSSAQMTLDPRGVAQLGESSRLVLDRVTVDEITGRKESFLSLLVGRLRLALSPDAEADVTIDTPTSTIGVKGTDVRLWVGRGGTTVIAVWEGVVTVRPKVGGQPFVLDAGWAVALAPGRPPTPRAFLDPEGGLGSPAAGGPDFTDPSTGLVDPPLGFDAGDLPIERGPGANLGGGIAPL